MRIRLRRVHINTKEDELYCSVPVCLSKNLNPNPNLEAAQTPKARWRIRLDKNPFFTVPSFFSFCLCLFSFRNCLCPFLRLLSVALHVYPPVSVLQCICLFLSLVVSSASSSVSLPASTPSPFPLSLCTFFCLIPPPPARG